MALLSRSLADARPAGASPEASRRDPWKDNARLALITLVVFGHCLEPLRDIPSLRALYLFIYLFHIPAFAFLSGAVARDDADLRLLRTVAFRLLLPYLLFQGLYTLAAQVPGWPGNGPSGVTTPYWLLWYLPSLAAWRLLLPLFTRMRYPLVLACLLALVAGGFDDIGYPMSLSRTAVFFPLFLLGHLQAAAWRDHLQGPWVRAAAVAILLVMALAADAVPDSRWLYGSYGYGALGTDEIQGPLWRVLRLALGALGSAAFLALTPRRAFAASAAGGRSLQAYLAHGFIVKFAVAAGVFGWLEAFGLPVLIALGLLLVAWVLVRLLASIPAARLLEPLTSPRWIEERLWRPRDRQEPGR